MKRLQADERAQNCSQEGQDAGRSKVEFVLAWLGNADMKCWLLGSLQPGRFGSAGESLAAAIQPGLASAGGDGYRWR